MNTSSPHSLRDNAFGVLRKRVQDYETQLLSLRKRVAQLENEEARINRRVVSAEADAEVLLEAVRVLAYQTPRETAGGSRARADARKLLESRKITPPHSLGASRQRVKRRKKLDVVAS
jgi:cell division septum initiation protein DivIVA